ncbi:MAG: hypothetical protein BJ554DRAFT_8142, partial [Olpidium bornovanus]
MRLPSPGADADARHRLGAVPNPFRDGDLGEADDYGVQRAGLGARGHGARPGAPRARTVLKLATISRLVAVAWAALSFVAVGEYDKSAGLSLGPPSPDGDAGRLPPYDFWAAAQANSAPPRTPWDCLLTGRECSVSTVVGAVRRLIRPLVRWDALHFRHIAEEGYIWEHEFAFFPLLPAVMRLGAETGEDEATEFTRIRVSGVNGTVSGSFLTRFGDVAFYPVLCMSLGGICSSSSTVADPSPSRPGGTRWNFVHERLCCLCRASAVP